MHALLSQGGTVHGGGTVEASLKLNCYVNVLRRHSDGGGSSASAFPTKGRVR
jgi:hypothetical protein